MAYTYNVYSSVMLYLDRVVSSVDCCVLTVLLAPWMLYLDRIVSSVDVVS
jgi:hypothetical protein